MSLLTIAEAYAAWCLIAGLCCIFAFVAYDMWCDGDAERRIQFLISDERTCDDMAVQLEEIRNLPERQPWQRWA